jgi:hypothetical protein
LVEVEEYLNPNDRPPTVEGVDNRTVTQVEVEAATQVEVEGVDNRAEVQLVFSDGHLIEDGPIGFRSLLLCDTIKGVRYRAENREMRPVGVRVCFGHFFLVQKRKETLWCLLDFVTSFARPPQKEPPTTTTKNNKQMGGVAGVTRVYDQNLLLYALSFSAPKNTRYNGRERKKTKKKPRKLSGFPSPLD